MHILQYFRAPTSKFRLIPVTASGTHSSLPTFFSVEMRIYYIVITPPTYKHFLYEQSQADT